jgi:hypothetical protein
MTLYLKWDRPVLGIFEKNCLCPLARRSVGGILQALHDLLVIA